MTNTKKNLLNLTFNPITRNILPKSLSIFFKKKIRHHLNLFIVVLTCIAISFSFTACTKDSEKTTTTTSILQLQQTQFPLIIESGGHSTKIETNPHKIISLSPTTTETLYALGAGSNVIAVDTLSNYPKEVPKADIDAMNPNVESIIQKQPDLVILSYDSGAIKDKLTQFQIPVLLQPAATNLDEMYKQISDIGKITNTSNNASNLVASIKKDIDYYCQQISKSAQGKTYFYELDSSLYTITSKTFLGEIFTKCGLVNIADASPSKTNSYPQLSSEYVISANPNYIFLADSPTVKKQDIKNRTGWSNIDSVKNDKIIEIQSDIASRWSPRIVDLIKTIHANL